MTATLSLRVYTGTDAGTESSAQTGITLTDADALSGGPVMPGSNSYERWVRLRVDSPPAVGVTNFFAQNTGELPDGVEIRFGVTDIPSTPVNTTSLIATHEFQSDRKYIFDVNSYADVGDHTRYLVFQEQVSGAANSGGIDTQSIEFGWQES